MLPVRSPRRRCTVRVCGDMEPCTALRVSNNDVPVDERVGGWTAEPVIEAGLLELILAMCVRSPTGPCRLKHLCGAVVAGSPADPSEHVAQTVVPADDEASNAASEGMEPVGVELLQALSTSGSRGVLLNRITTPLISAAASLTPETKRNTEPKSAAHAKLEVCEPGGGGGRRRQEPSPGTGAPAPTKPGARSRWQRGEETCPRGLRSSPGEETLSLGEGRGAVLPAPR